MPVSAKSSPVAPCVSTDTLPNVAAVLNVRVTATAEPVLPIFTVLKFVFVTGWTVRTVKLCETVGAAA